LAGAVRVLPALDLERLFLGSPADDERRRVEHGPKYALDRFMPRRRRTDIGPLAVDNDSTKAARSTVELRGEGAHSLPWPFPSLRSPTRRPADSGSRVPAPTTRGHCSHAPALVSTEVLARSVQGGPGRSARSVRQWCRSIDAPVAGRVTTPRHGARRSKRPPTAPAGQRPFSLVGLAGFEPRPLDPQTAATRPPVSASPPTSDDRRSRSMDGHPRPLLSAPNG
jgi:hypothetical protein